MLMMGDEAGRTLNGNNNGYCQDTELSWFNWTLPGKNLDLFNFVKACIAFRHTHPVLRNGYFLRGEDYLQKGYIDIAWHGLRINTPDWSETSRALAFMLGGGYAKGGLAEDTHVYMAINMDSAAQTFELPPAPDKTRWHLFANTTDKGEVHWPGSEPVLNDQKTLRVGDFAVAILLAK